VSGGNENKKNDYLTLKKEKSNKGKFRIEWEGDYFRMSSGQIRGQWFVSSKPDTKLSVQPNRKNGAYRVVLVNEKGWIETDRRDIEVNMGWGKNIFLRTFLKRTNEISGAIDPKLYTGNNRIGAAYVRFLAEELWGRCYRAEGKEHSDYLSKLATKKLGALCQTVRDDFALHDGKNWNQAIEYYTCGKRTDHHFRAYVNVENFLTKKAGLGEYGAGSWFAVGMACFLDDADKYECP